MQSLQLPLFPNASQSQLLRLGLDQNPSKYTGSLLVTALKDEGRWPQSAVGWRGLDARSLHQEPLYSVAGSVPAFLV